MIAVGEHATRVISRVEYCKETDQLVGFVLPCDKAGKPVCDSFVTISFKSMEECFCFTDVAKYAFVYMAQPLAEDVPAFCVCCMGTNNKFAAEHVLKRWTQIFLECKKREITQLSFGADGDSQELKAMHVSTQLLVPPEFFNSSFSIF